MSRDNALPLLLLGGELNWYSISQATKSLMQEELFNTAVENSVEKHESIRVSSWLLVLCTNCT